MMRLSELRPLVSLIGREWKVRWDSLLSRPGSCPADGVHLKPPIWFAFDETRPLAFFAGIWTRWTSVRKVKEGETTNDIFGFLTTEPNALVATYHPKAMSLILTNMEEADLWMTSPAPEALVIVARGEKKDEGGISG